MKYVLVPTELTREMADKAFPPATEWYKTDVGRKVRESAIQMYMEDYKRTVQVASEGVPQPDTQKLIDLVFGIAIHSAMYWNTPSYDKNKHMAWVADQLRIAGYDTQPMGMSWGVLKQ